MNTLSDAQSQRNIILTSKIITSRFALTLEEGERKISVLLLMSHILLFIFSHFLAQDSAEIRPL